MFLIVNEIQKRKYKTQNILRLKKFDTKNDFLLKSQSTHSCLFRSVYIMISNFLF